MDKEFDRAIQSVAQRNAAPVAEAKRALAPVRAEAEKLLHEFNDVAAKLRPGLLAAQGKLHQAIVLGYAPQNLQRHLRQVFGDGLLPGLIDGGAEAFRDVIRQIDGLTPSDVYQNIPVRLAGRPTALRGNIGALKRLAAAVEQDVRELTELLKSASPAARPSVVERPDPPAQVPVETTIPGLLPQAPRR